MISGSPATEKEKAVPGSASWSVRPTHSQFLAKTASRSNSKNAGEV